MLFICTAIDFRNTAHVDGIDRYHEHINTSYASLEIARADPSLLFADEGYIFTALHTRRVGNKKEGDIKAGTLQYSCAPYEKANESIN